jgi:BNR/Asp-box repeat
MTFIRFSKALFFLSLASAFGAAPEGGRLGRYIVGPNVQVSRAQSTLQHYETQIAADPERPGHLIAGAYVVNANRTIDNVFYVSFDHGRTWTHTLTVPVGVDPACAISIKGTAFAASIHDVTQPDGKSDSFLVVHRSSDGGRTWHESAIKIDTRSLDRDYITVDDRHLRVYVHGYLQQPKDADGQALPSGFGLYTSTDAGRSFNQAIVRPSVEYSAPWFFPANGVVSADGTFIALFAELDKTKRNVSYRIDSASAPQGVNGALKVVRSRDGGQTLEPPSKIADVYYDWRVPQLSMPSLAIDRSAGLFRGRLYAVWPDARLEGRTQIFLSCSNDVGQTWSTPRVVIDDAALKPDDQPNNFMPMIAVNNKGVIGVSWYDRRDNSDNLGYWVRFSASLDGGATWLPSVRVSTHANLKEESDSRFNGGDTAGLTADADGVFHPLWIDNRTGIHQMWTATVVVLGERVRTRTP